MEAIVAHLVAQGHRHIGHVTGPTRFLHSPRGTDAVRWRHEGRLGGDGLLGCAGRGGDPRNPQRSGAAVGPDLRQRCHGGRGLGAAAELGVRVPKQLSIVSFDDSVAARVTHPSITSLARDTYTLGSTVA